MKKNLISSRWKLRTKGEKLIMSVMLVLFILYALSLVYPLLWASYNALKSTREFNTDQFAWPKAYKWENFVDAFSVDVNGTNIYGTMFNSVWMTVVSVVCGLIFSSMTAYVVAKYKFRFASLIYAVSVFIQIIPLVGTMPATYELYHSTLEIANKPYIYWVTWCGGFGFSFLMLYSAFQNLSWTYAEAAFIDGASNFRTFLSVMLPMIKPVLVSLAIINSIGAWNDYMTSYLYMTDYPTLALAVYELSTEASRMGIPLYFAIIVITVIPTLIIFVLFQNTIMQNITTGGLKG